MRPFSINLLALVNGEPRVLNLKQALRDYLDHRQEMVRRRSEYDLQKAQERAHILEGMLIALDNLDEIIDTIRRSQTVETAQANLQKKFKLSEVQARAVLDMPLRRLAGLERRKLKDEFDEKQKLIKYLQGILATPAEMRTVIKEELLAIKKEYGDVRRTQIVDKEASQVITQADLLPDEQVWVMVGEKGTVGRTTSPEPIKIPLKPDELPLALLQASTQDVLYLFTADGQSVSLPVYQLPQATDLGQGTHYADMKGGSVVTLVCDSGQRYGHTYYSDEWLQDNGLNCHAERAALAASLDSGQLPRELPARWQIAGELAAV